MCSYIEANDRYAALFCYSFLCEAGRILVFIRNTGSFSASCQGATEAVRPISWLRYCSKRIVVVLFVYFHRLWNYAFLPETSPGMVLRKPTCSRPAGLLASWACIQSSPSRRMSANSFLTKTLFFAACHHPDDMLNERSEDDMAVYGYARVSSADQNLDRQLDALRGFPVEDGSVFTDKSSGKDFERPGYRGLLRFPSLMGFGSSSRVGSAAR